MLRRGHFFGLLAVSLVVATGCQNVGDGALLGGSPPTSTFVFHGLIQLPAGTVIGVDKGADSRQVFLQFSSRTSAAQARAAGQQYSLELIGGPLMGGPYAPDRFLFEVPQISIQAMTPTTGVAIFPKYTKLPDRLAFLRDHDLRLLRWQHPEEDFTTAEVQLPPSALAPELLDPLTGRYRIYLPAGLTTFSVSTWAVEAGLKLLDYANETGVTIVRPSGWVAPVVTPVVSPPVSYAAPSTPMPRPTSNLYVQFATTLSIDAISSIAQGLELRVVELAGANLATLSVDESRTNAVIQLLSDMASVQCVSTSPDPCRQIVGATSSTTTAPQLQLVGQASGLRAQVNGGILELDWNPAAGATAYAVFTSASAAGPYQLLAVVAGQQNTSFLAFDVTPPGVTAYYAVIALHPCLQNAAGPQCDVSAPGFDMSAASWAAWSNPAPTSQAAMAPGAITLASGARTTQGAPAASTTAAAPAQTQAAAGPMDAPSALGASATSGHVTLTWQGVTGAGAYRVYRSDSSGIAIYVATTPDTSFVDVTGVAGQTYAYRVAAISQTGLVGRLSATSGATWAATTETPRLLRSLPAESNVLSGTIRLQVDASSGSGQGSVQWRISGPAAALTIGTAIGQPTSQSLSWSAARTWDTDSVPDGTYEIAATIIDASGPQVTTTTRYRIQNGAPTGPTSLGAVAKGNGVLLTWRQPSANTGAMYRLYKDTPISGSPTAEFSADARSYFDGSSPNGQHVYQLVLVDAGGHQSSAAGVTITAAGGASPASAPSTDVQVLLPNGQRIAPSGRATDRLFLMSRAGDARFQISSDGSTWSDLGGASRCGGEGCMLDLQLGDLPAGSYGVRAITAAGGASSVTTFIRAAGTRYHAPSSLAVNVTGLGVGLRWTAPTGALPISYRIERQVDGDAWAVLDYVSSTSYFDAAAPPGATIGYRVAAVDPEGNAGDASTAITASTSAQVLLAEVQSTSIAQAPSGLVVFAANGHPVLGWSAAAGSDGYLVERQTQAGGPYSFAGIAGGTMFADTSIMATGEVTYRVLALNGVVAGPASASASTIVIANTPNLTSVSAADAVATSPTAPAHVAVSVSGAEVQVTWAASAPANTVSYEVYRVDPAVGTFNLAAAGLMGTTFTDTSLATGTYGYVVTATSADGKQSPFSTPAWAGVTSAADALNVQLLSPTADQRAYLQGDAVQALAKVTAGAGLADVTFAFAPHGGAWRPLPASPSDPRGPAPLAPILGSGSGGAWVSTLRTSGLAPGTYDLRVQVRDRSGKSQETIAQLTVAAADARGPPSGALTTSSLAGRVHLAWSAPAAGFIVQRSIFGPAGLFETLANVQDSTYDDRSAIPGQTYWYRVVDPSGIASPISSGIASPAAQLDAMDQASIQVGDVSSSELSVTIASTVNTHSMPTNVGTVLGNFSIDASSLASGQVIHRLGEEAQLSYRLPGGLSPDEISSLALYHWDNATQGWINENASIDPAGTALTATIDHLSDFMVAAATSPASSSAGSQPPPPPTDFRGSPSSNPGLRLPPSPAPLQVAADGEVTSLRSANSRTYRVSDGRLQQILSDGPLNFRDSSGNWQKIDTTLVQDASGHGDMHNTAGPLQLDLPSDLGRSPIRVSSGGASLSFVLEGARPSSRSTSGNRASYHGILSGVDATYAVVPAGLKENLVILSRPTSTVQFNFDLSVSGVTLQRQPDGSVQAIDAAGLVQFVITAPSMHDAPNAASEIGNVSASIGVTLTGGAGSYRLTYTPDFAWLSDPSRVYPVTIDPGLTVNWSNSNSYDDQINTYSPDYNYSSSTYNYLPIGFTPFGSGSNPSRAMVQFNGFLGEGYYASSAYLQMYQYTAYGSGRGNCCTTFVASQATSSWSFTGVTWNNQPGTSTYWCSCQASAASGGGWVTWDVTGLVRAWETHSAANYGFTVYATSENGPWNTDEFFYSHWNGSYIPQLVVYYDSYTYSMAAGFPGLNNAVPNGGTTHMTVLIANTGTATWGSDVKLSWGWVQNGTVISQSNPWVARVLLPYAISSGTDVTLSFDLPAPTVTTSGTVQVWFTLVRENYFWFNSLSWCSGCGADFTKITVNIASESATITGQSVPPLLLATSGSLLTVPVTVTNTSLAGVYNWSGSNYLDIVEVSSREYRQSTGGVVPFANLWTVLPQDVAAGSSTTVNVLVRVPGEPGDYWMRVDLVRYRYEATTTWFEDSGNRALEVHVRVVAPGYDKVTLVPVLVGDGSSLGTNTTNGYATLAATDFSIPERGSIALQVLRTYNGANAVASTSGTGATGSTYGQGWTFDFQRNLQLGGPVTSTLGMQTGILTDSSGRAWLLTWNPNRQLWEDAAGDRVVIPSTAVVQSASGDLQAPGVRPVDVISRTTGSPIVSDAGAVRGVALNLDGASQGPNALVLAAGTVPAMQNGTIELWFRPDFNMSTDTNRHIILVDHKNNFGLQWNANTSNPRTFGFFTTNDGVTYDTVESAPTAWTQGTWHHISITWLQNGQKQLLLDTGTIYSSASHSQGPVAEVFVGYNPDGSPNMATYPAVGAMAELRIEGRVLRSGELLADAAAGTRLNPDGSTLYLGTFSNGVQSAAGTYTLRNPDQSFDRYAPSGQLVSAADRFGNAVDYAWNGAQLASITDHALPGRTITFLYSAGQIVAQDFTGRTITYALSAQGDLVSVTRSNNVPSPTTGVVSSQPFTTSYAYLPNHALQSVTDPMGRKTRLSYDNTYAQLVLAENPSAYFRLNEIAVAPVNSVGGVAATVAGGVTTAQPGAITGDPDTSFGFDGSTGYFSAAITAPPAGGAFSLEAWANQSAAGASTQGVVGFGGAGASYTTGIWLTAAGVPNFQVTSGTGSTQTTISGSAALAPGWHHLVATYDGTNARLYADGLMVAGPTPVSAAGGLNTLFVGQYPGSFFKGLVGEVAMYGAALGLDRVQRHYVAGRLGTGAAVGTYAADIVLDQPVGYWRLGDSTGTRATDYSGGGRTGIAAGGVTFGTGGALTGDPSGAATLDGSTGFIGIPDNASAYGTGTVTAEAWINATGYTAGSIVNRRTTGNVGGFTLELTTAGILYFFVYIGSSWYSASSAFSVPLGTWHHVAGTYDGSTIRVYIDAINVASTSVSGAMNAPSGPVVWIGRNAAGAAYFNGSLDEVAIYRSALSATQLLVHYQAGRYGTFNTSGPYKGSVLADKPLGYWRLNDPSGSGSAVDSSGNGYNGTYGGSVVLQQPAGFNNEATYSAHFDGSTAYVTTPTQSISNSITVEAWVYASTYNQSGFIVGKNLVNGNWELFVYSNTIYWRVGGTGGCSSTGFTDLTTPAPSANAWHHFVATASGGTARIFIDGNQVASSTAMTAIGNSTGAIDFGRYGPAQTCAPNGAYYFSGIIQDVAVYGSVLPAGRVLAHYQAGRPTWSTAARALPTSYSARVITDGPVGYWRLDEAGGAVAYDRSGYANNGTYSSTGVTLNQAGALGTDSDAAAKFDGTSGTVVIPASASLNTAGPISLEAWVKWPTLNAGPLLEYNSTTGSIPWGVHLWAYPTSDAIWVNFMDPAGNSHGVQTPGGLLVAGNWYHIVAAYDGANGVVYVNGQEVARNYLGSFTPQTSFNLNIAKRPSGTPQYSNATIDEVAVYPYGLSGAQVLAHYNAAFGANEQRVTTIWDGRSNPIASFRYNDDLAVTRVINPPGLNSYYTFQTYGGRTLSVTDTGGNTTRYEYDGGAAYRLLATVSPAGVRTSQVLNSGAPIGQQTQVLMSDQTPQPSASRIDYVNGSLPLGSTLYTTNDSWGWDPVMTLDPGKATHRSMPSAGIRQQYFTLPNLLGTFIPAGSRLMQWVYIEPGQAAPLEVMLQLLADTNSWEHRPFWGSDLLPWGTTGTASRRFQAAVPQAGKWIALIVELGPTEGTKADVDLAGHLLTGIAYSMYGGTAAVWFGPTQIEFPGAPVSDSTRAISRNSYNSTNDVVASVDPNGIAKITDYDGFGLARQVATGVELPTQLIQEDTLNSASAWTFEFGYAGTSSGTSTVQYNGMGSVTQTHTGAGLQSDFYMDRVGLVPGTYLRATVWAETGAGTGAGGASLAVESQAQGTIRRSASIQSSTWMQLSVPVMVDSSGKVRIHLWQENFSGTTYWADMRLEDITPAPDATFQPTARQSSWNLSLASTLTATWSNLAWGGIGNSPSRKISVTSATTAAGDVSDTLTTVALHNGYTYVISAWASASVPGTSIDFSLRDANGNVLAMDNPSTCTITTSPTLCQNSLTYTGADLATGQLTILYGGFGARDVYVSHPLVALASEIRDYTAFGQLTRISDIFGHDKRTAYDAQSLYPIQTTQKVVQDNLHPVMPNNSYTSAVMADQPLAYWRLGDSSGTTATDSSGNGFNGTISSTGATLGQPGPLPTDPGKSMAFDGSSGTVALNVTSVDTTSGHQVTAEFWMYWNGGTAASMPFLFGAYDLWLLPGTGFGFNTSNNDVYGVPMSAVPANKWLHVVAVFTNGGVAQNQLYINGVAQSLAQLSGTPIAQSATAQANISGRTGAGYFFNGRVGEVALYNGALSAVRVQSHFALAQLQPQAVAGAQPTYPSSVVFDRPKGYWRLDELAGTAAADASGNGQTGTYAGTYTLGQAGALPADPDLSVSLNGSTGYIGVPVFSLPAFTAEVWWDGTPGANGWSGPIQQRQSGYSGFQFVNNVWSTTSFTPHLVIWNGSAESAQFQSTVSYSMPFGALKHFVWTYDGTRARLFVNGTEIPVVTSSVAGFAYSCTCIGYGYQPVGGRVDEAAIYNYPLSPSRVAAHYQARLAALAIQPSYPGTVSADLPLAYWRLNDSSGNTASDISGNGSNGTISGGVRLGVSSPMPRDYSSHAIGFDGQSAAIAGNMAKIDTAAGHQVTVEFWMYSTGTPNDIPFGFGSYDLFMNYPTVGNLGFNTSHSDVYGVTGVTQNTWLHVVAIFTNGNIAPNQLYINGVRQSLSQVAGASGYSGTVTAAADIGSWPSTNGYYFGGSIAEVAVYNGALSPARVLAHYQSATGSVAGIQPTPPPAPSLPALANTSLVTQVGYNPLGQQVTFTRVNGASSITDKHEMDSWGRVTAQIRNYLAAGPTDPQTNVRTGHAFDLDGEETDTYTQGAASGTWVITHQDYDVNGNPIDRIENYVAGAGQTSPQNVPTTWTYDVLNRVTDELRPVPGCSASCATTDRRTVYDSSGRVLRQIQNYGGVQDVSQANVTTTYGYDSDGRVVDTFSPISVGATSGTIDDRSVYDGIGRLITTIKAYTVTPFALVQAAPAETDLTLDLGGRVISETGPGTGSPAKRIVTNTVLDALGESVSITVDATGSLPAVTRLAFDPRGAIHEWSPPTQQLPTSGMETSTYFDLGWRPVRLVVDEILGAPVAPDVNLTSTTAYDGFGHATDVTDPKGIVTHTDYDALNRKADEILDPSGLNLQTSYGYDLAGNPVSITRPRDGTPRVDTSQYDPLHRLTAVTLNYVNGAPVDSRTNLTEQYTYDQLGDRLTASDPLGRVIVTAYDVLGRTASVTANCVGSTFGVCDGAITPDQNVTTRFKDDAAGDKVADISPRTGGSDSANLTTGYGYDAQQRLVTMTEDSGTSSAGHANLVTTYTYDPAGNLLTTTDGLGHVTTNTVDDFGRVTVVKDASNNAMTTNYSPAGEITSKVDGRNQTLMYGLDRVSRTLGIAFTHADGTTGSLSYVYDADGQLTAFQADGQGSTMITYDNAGRVTQGAAPSGTTSYCNSGYVVGSNCYFLDGATRSASDPSGLTIFTEDALGRLASTQDPIDGASRTTYQYDLAGRLIQRNEATGLITNVSWTHLDQLQSKAVVVSGAPIATDQWQNQYDVAGNRTQESSQLPGDTSAGVANFTYDNLNQVATAAIPGQQALAFAYDAAHNRCVTAPSSTAITACTPLQNGWTTYSYQANEGLLSSSVVGGATTAFGVDADGNQLQDSLGHYLKFDSLNRLELVQDSAHNTLVAFTYDAIGRLIKRVQGGTTLQFVYRGLEDQIVQELTGTSPAAVAQTYAWDDRGRMLTAQVAGTNYSVLTNPHGDVVGLSSGNGSIANWAHYGTWGQVVASGSPIAGTQVPFGYQSGYTDSTTGLVKMGLRWFDPVAGRFASADPTASAGSLSTPLDRSIWDYANNNPLRFVDPIGLDSNDPSELEDQEVAGYDTKKKAGFEQHHGVLDAWLSAFLGTARRAKGVPTVALDHDTHALTTAVIREFLREKTGRPVGGKIDWGKVTPREILELSEKMFEKAGVSREVRDKYYGELQKYIGKIANHIVAQQPQGPTILVFPLAEPIPYFEHLPAQDLDTRIPPFSLHDLGPDQYVEKFPVGEPIAPLFLPFPRSTYVDPGLLTFIRHFVRPPSTAGADAGTSGSGGQPGTNQTPSSDDSSDRDSRIPDGNYQYYTPSTSSQPSYSTSSSTDNSGIVIGGLAITGTALIVWWALKPVGLLCGPLAPVCVVAA